VILSALARGAGAGDRPLPRHVKRLYFRGDAAFANPEIYEFLEAEGLGYRTRLPANRVVQDKIGYLLKRPVGRLPHEVRRYFASFREISALIRELPPSSSILADQSDPPERTRTLPRRQRGTPSDARVTASDLRQLGGFGVSLRCVMSRPCPEIA
jgi:hypothetical protein